MAPDFVSNEEIVIAARKNIGQGPWDYLVGGSESETTLRRNRLAFDRVAFRRVQLFDFQGFALGGPVLLATGLEYRVHHESPELADAGHKRAGIL